MYYNKKREENKREMKKKSLGAAIAIKAIA
jgi:hypothetical protein